MAGVGIRKFADKWLKSTLVLRYKVAFVNICKKQKAKKKKNSKNYCFCFWHNPKEDPSTDRRQKRPSSQQKDKQT